MTEQQALQKMEKDIRLRNLSESTYKNYTRNVKKFLAKGSAVILTAPPFAFVLSL